MAEDQQGNALSATFPDPPPFYKHFTSKNLTRLKEAKEAARSKESDKDQLEKPESSRDPAAELRELDLPSDLRYLVPPEPPQTGKYRSFGDHYDLHEPLPSLSAQGLEQLYTSPPTSPTADTSSALTSSRANTLKLLARSILLNYLELVGLLSLDPEKYGPKIDHLSTIFINAHHLINEYRPHQARETLILTMEEQVEKKRAEVQGIQKMKEKVDQVLEGLRKAEGAHGADASYENGVVLEDKGKGGGESEWKSTEQKEIWDALEVLE